MASEFSLPESAAAKPLSPYELTCSASCPQGSGTEGHRRWPLHPLPTEAGTSREAESDVTGDLRFLTHLPQSIFFSVTCLSDWPEVLISQTLLLSPQHLSLAWTPWSLAYPHLSSGCQSRTLQSSVLGTETLTVPQPPHWPSPLCRQPGPAGITASLPPSLPPSHRHGTIYGSPGPSHP